MSHKIEDLRAHMFATLEALRDPKNPMEVERARAVAEVGRVIVDSAKVEVQAMEVAGAMEGTGFITLPGRPAAPTKPALAALPGSAISKGR